jgi:hypothetical protein
VGPCHHGIEHLQVMDGEDDLQIWRIATNILSSSGEPTRGGPLRWTLSGG